MKLIIAGSRRLTIAAPIKAFLTSTVAMFEEPVTEVVSGGARGVDSIGEEWARENGIPVKRFPAEWNKHGKRAGPLRNVEMAKYADALIAVWDGESPGTKHMIAEAERRGLTTIQIAMDLPPHREGTENGR